MPLFEEVRGVKEEVARVRALAEENRERGMMAQEQINGERGINAAIKGLSQDLIEAEARLSAKIDKLYKAAYWLGALIIASCIGFAFSVLTFLAP
jgi:hypothetical protein